jgi:hypothetical protein
MTEKKQNRTCKTPPFRMAFPALLEMKEFQGELKYGLEAVFPPDTDLSELKKLASQVKKEMWGDNSPKNLKSPFIKGDQYNDEHDNHRSEIVGTTFMRLNTTNKPGVIDLKGRNIDDKDEIYSGRWAKATVYCHAYDNKGSKGITFLLNNVLLLQDDEPWGVVRRSAQEDFGDEVEPSEAQNEFAEETQANQTETEDEW